MASLISPSPTQVQIDLNALKQLAASDRRMGLWLEHWIEWRTKQARPAQICLLPEQEDKIGQVWMSGRGAGKLIPLTEQIPTPSGWATMGSLVVGDKVFDESGELCSVTAISSIQLDKTYNIIFSDGESIVAGASHQWVTWTHRERKAFLRSKYEDISRFPDNWPEWKVKRKNNYTTRDKVDLAWEMILAGKPTGKISKATGIDASAVSKMRLGKSSRTGVIVDDIGPQIRTTQEIKDTLKVGVRSDLNHCIPLADPLSLPHKNLPVDPWCLGYFLGNGHAGSGQVTAGSHNGNMDGAFIEGRFSDAGYKVFRKDYPEKGQSKLRITGFRKELEDLGALWKEGIPSTYMRGSATQRLELLRGLHDSDGYACDERNHVEFSNTNKKLAFQTKELICSLGERCSITETRAKLYGIDYGPHWRIHWSPSILNPFSLPRKADRLVISGKSQRLRHRHRMIVDVVEVDPVPMKCITVDSPNSMYLVGHAMIPTHNTRTGAEETFAYAMLHHGCRQSIIAPTFSDCRSTCVEGDSGLIGISPDGVGPSSCITKWNRSIGEIEFYNGSFIQLFSAEEPNRLRGPQFARGWYEEVAAWGDGNDVALRATWDMAMFGLRLKPRPTFIVTTTPKPLPFIRELAKRTDVIITRESTYANKDNLGDSFLREIKKYEGTKLGRQEIHGEIVDLDSGGIFAKDQLKLWPAGKAFPIFEFVVATYDTAFTEKDTGSYSANSTWGVFKEPSRGDYHALLLDCWRDHLGYPDLRKRMMENWQTSYGSVDPEAVEYAQLSLQPRKIEGRKPDIMLIEKKASGQSLLQDLRANGINCMEGNPGREDKTMRAHMASPVVAGGRIWIPESYRNDGSFIDWAQPFVDEIVGNNPSTDVYDWGDGFTQMCAYLQSDKWLGMPIRETPLEEDLDNDAPSTYNDQPANPYMA